MLRKACSWVSSPLAVNLLLRACGATGPVIDKYEQLSKHLEGKNENTLRSRVFISEDTIKFRDLGKQHIDFRNKKGADAIYDWIYELGKEFEFEKVTFPTNTTAVLTNIHSFKDTWKDNSEGPSMKVYNSFSYTQDVKYEARILELPTSGDFKFVILVPNETDVLQDLFLRLKSEGLEAVTSSLQPLFTTSTRLEAPSMSFYSKITRKQELITNSLTGLYYGNVKVGAKGINITVLTCLYSPVDLSQIEEDSSSSTDLSSFYFALIFQDTPLFIGKYCP